MRGDIRAMLELTVEDLDAAERTIIHFLTVHPDNASAHGQAAMLAATREDALGAVAKLQDALERVTETIPEHVFEAIGAGFEWMLECEEQDLPGLWLVTVVVRKTVPGRSHIEVSLSQLVMDPTRKGSTLDLPIPATAASGG